MDSTLSTPLKVESNSEPSSEAPEVPKRLDGCGQLSLKVPNIEFDFDVRFLTYLYLLTKPNVENNNYDSVQMSIQSQI